MREPRRGNGIARTVGTFTLGAAAGSILALLYAPASGKVTRRRIGMRVRALRQQTVRQLGRTRKLLAEATTEKIQHAREWVTEHLPNGNGKHPVRQRAVRHA